MQGTRPTNRREFMNKLVDPYVEANPFSTSKGNPNSVYTEPKQAGLPEENRAYETTTRKDQQKDYYIGIKDLDEAVMWYFKNKLKLSVTQNNTRIEIPVIYANPESWKSVQRDGYYRDAQGKLQAPLIAFKRNTITQNRGLGNKLDGNHIRNVQLIEKGYSARNYYTNFPLFKKYGNKKSPEKEYVVSMSPDYVTVEYSCAVWTYYIEQMDKLVEALNFASRAYWGDPNRFLFHSSIETFSEEITYDFGEDRAVRVNFNITLNGYLIPDSINKQVAGVSRLFGGTDIIFGLETFIDSKGAKTAINQPTTKNLANMVAADSTNTVVNNYTINYGASAVVPSDLDFFSISKTVTTIVDAFNFTAGPPAVIAINETWATPPTIPGASIQLDYQNFEYFVNGVNINSFVTNFQSSGNLTIDTTGLGFDIKEGDEITITGKFV